MTYDTTRAEIKYKNIAFAFIDVPGHEELIKNMISGASYGEIALLLVSAKSDEGIRPQTKRHVFIAKMLGINTLVVAVNKIDTLRYSEKRYESIKEGLLEYLKNIGFEEKNISFVPISAYTGDNLVKASKKMPWYHGDTLMSVLYKAAKQKNTDNYNKLRIVAQGAIEAPDVRVVGKLISGTIKVGDMVRLMPIDMELAVRSIFVKGTRVKSASVGENVALSFDRKIGQDPRGMVICNFDDKDALKKEVSALVFCVASLKRGYKIKFNGTDIRPMTFDMVKGVNIETGELTPDRILAPLNAGIVNVKFDTGIVAEKFDTLKELGRFLVYNGSEFAAIGIIMNC